jgi:hypothetical protein
MYFGGGLLTVLFVSFGCGEKQEPIPSEYRQKVIQIGESATSKLMRSLSAHLQEALAESDLEEAFEACAVLAQPLTAETQDLLPAGITIKRTSFKFRNPENAPDRLEAEALRHFEQALVDQGSLPGNLIQRIETDGKYRFYRPLRIGELCLKCHAAREHLAPEVLLSLEENYPDDRAVGFALGDFRGVIRVSIPKQMVENGGET